ncbi:uncharacterized protein N7482_006675 [Penicillium canariense]|uniref:N-acetylgalactosaminide beta-1,3-galactosyltransferase n=1 Tax=Penicillium canariense TaxID=189055 RepID=A0A9W9HXM4_9EURO|nr:uncharacterized protein N7482_006675 [Penicillium canariense]KAJ5159671.1 hypothetical protein N7482_006675 [Penicillium canariense]
MLALPARYGRWVPLLGLMTLVLLFLHLIASLETQKTQVIFEPESHPAAKNETESKPKDKTSHSCRPLPGVENILVVMKTGITEAQDKVPVHLRTTLRCIPHKLIVSDFEEDIAGVRTHDVFRNTSESLLLNGDFALYNRARAGGRDALTQQDHTKVANGAAGMTDNPGWKLDKWKFLPMIQEARAYRPDVQWYVFLEADTYTIWPNLLAWLAQLDSQKKLYLGNQMQIGEDVFAHGGSGFVLSHAAMHAVADYHAAHVDRWNYITETQWAGDCVLGMALKQAGVDLTWSWPHVIAQSLWEQDALGESFGRTQWCYPAMTFHHMTPTDIDRLYEFDRRWFANENNTVLTYSDIFRNFVRPMLSDRLDNWSNFAADGVALRNENPVSKPQAFHHCAELCAQTPGCMQYRLDVDGKCYTSDWALRGLPTPGVRSGTMMWRVDAAMLKKGKCKKPEWVLE